MKLPDLLFSVAAFLSFVFSVYLWFNGQKDSGIYVGLWVPSILLVAVYTKLLKREMKKRS